MNIIKITFTLSQIKGFAAALNYSLSRAKAYNEMKWVNSIHYYLLNQIWQKLTVQIGKMERKRNGIAGSMNLNQLEIDLLLLMVQEGSDSWAEFYNLLLKNASPKIEFYGIETVVNPDFF